MKFPDNYTLYVHKKGIKTDQYNARTDAYLFGAPHLGPHTARSSQAGPTVFRSPTEFVPHAIWLMRGCTGQCDCKYCLPGQTQKDINRRLNHGVDVDSDDDDDNDNGLFSDCLLPSLIDALIPGLTSASRRRGVNSRTRRVRRDRTPPINITVARDYRVRATDPGPSSAT